MVVKGESITVMFTVWDITNNGPKTGDAGNLTLKLIKDGVVGDPTNSPAEVNSTYCPGIYKLVLTAAETAYSTISIGGISSSSGCIVVPIHLFTEQGILSKLDTTLEADGANYKFTEDAVENAKVGRVSLSGRLAFQ